MKKRILVLGIFVLTALAVCTILSAQIQLLMTPEINIVQIKRGSILDPETEEKVLYDSTLPLHALMQDEGGRYVLAIEKVDGVWGPELQVKRVEIRSINAMDESIFATGDFNAYPEGYAIYPSHPLKGGEQVKVRDK